MSDIYTFSDGKIPQAQALELVVLVDLEARWENLRAAGPTAEGQPSIQVLHAKQKAYDAFRAKLAAYNKRYRPAHAAEQLLNTPARLGPWCQNLRDLYLQVEGLPQVQAPTHVVDKAYRWAAWVADKKGKSRPVLAGPPATVRDAIVALEALIQWCADLGRVVPAA
jgi:hypothetical protein